MAAAMGEGRSDPGHHLARRRTPECALDRAPDRLRVRPVAPCDDDEIRRLFATTLVLGDPVPSSVRGFDRYSELCLDWFLELAREDSAVLVDGSSVVGYALVCTDSVAYRRWVRRRTGAMALGMAARGLRTGATGRFHRLRLVDGWELWRSGHRAPMPAHAHLNLARSERAGWGGRLLVDHIDRRCRLAGVPGWFGEINAPVGRRSAGLQRLGVSIVRRAPNRTLSWLWGDPVDRLTVVRDLTPHPVLADARRR